MINIQSTRLLLRNQEGGKIINVGLHTNVLYMEDPATTTSTSNFTGKAFWFEQFFDDEKMTAPITVAYIIYFDKEAKVLALTQTQKINTIEELEYIFPTKPVELKGVCTEYREHNGESEKIACSRYDYTTVLRMSDTNHIIHSNSHNGINLFQNDYVCALTTGNHRISGLFDRIEFEDNVILSKNEYGNQTINGTLYLRPIFTDGNRWHISIVPMAIDVPFSLFSPEINSTTVLSPIFN